MLILEILDGDRRGGAMLRAVMLPVEGRLTSTLRFAMWSVDMAHRLYRRILLERVNRGHGRHGRTMVARASPIDRNGEVLDRMENKEGRRVLPVNRASALIIIIIVLSTLLVCKVKSCRRRELSRAAQRL